MSPFCLSSIYLILFSNWVLVVLWYLAQVILFGGRGSIFLWMCFLLRYVYAFMFKPSNFRWTVPATKGGWVVAASIGAVEALKDQIGVCRWNYVFRSIEQRAKSRVQSYYHTHIISPPRAEAAPSGSGASAGRMMRMMGEERERVERREMCVKKLMNLSCWGPTTVRF